MKDHTITLQTSLDEAPLWPQLETESLLSDANDQRIHLAQHQAIFSTLDTSINVLEIGLAVPPAVAALAWKWG
jgi:hypothetical protein